MWPMSRRPTSARSRTHRHLGVVVALTVIVATACPVVREASRCRGDGWGQDRGDWILRCRSGRWRRAITKADYVRILAAEQERRASVVGRAQSFRGVGAWVDVYDWSPTFLASRGAGSPSVTPDAVDAMADAGAQVLYIQTAKAPLADDVLDRSVLQQFVDRARARGMRVVGWYLPTFDVAADLRRLVAAADLGLDGVGVDIEDRSLADLAERNRRLVELSTALRAARPTTPLAAIVLPPVVTDVVNPAYWPDFPWRALAPHYDAWMPMGYWTNRTTASGWRDGYRYTAENIDRVRAAIADPQAVVVPIGGLSDTANPADIDGFVRAALERGAIGGGLYDHAITSTAEYAQLAPLRR